MRQRKPRLFDEIFRDRLKKSTTEIQYLIEEQRSCFVEQRGIGCDHKQEVIKVVAMDLLCFLDGAGLHYLLIPLCPAFKRLGISRSSCGRRNCFLPRIIMKNLRMR